MKFYKLTNDKMFKAVFTKEKNRDLLEELLYEVTDTKFKVLTLTLTELPKDNIHIRGKILDIIAETTDRQIVNIELNNSDSEYLNRRNFAYICDAYSNAIETSKTYKNMSNFIQINLTNNKPDIPLKEKYTVNGEITRRKYIDNLAIYEINIQKAKKSWYNEPSGKKLISLLDCDEKELKNAKGDGLVEKVKKEVKYLNNDKKFVEFLSAEREEELYINSISQEKYEEGFEQRNIEIAKNMLNKNLDINLISEITSLSIEKINELK